MPAAGRIVLGIILVLCTWPAPCAEWEAHEAVATLNGEPITLSEVEERVAFQIYRLRGNIYQLLKRETDQIVEQKLLEMDARRRGLTLENLLRIEVDEKLAPVGEDEIRQYLKARHKNGEVDEQHRARARTFLARRAAIRRKMAYVEELRSRADLKFLIAPPQPPRVKIDIEGQPWRGNPAAPVTVVHFAAFNCELCTRSVRMLRDLMQDHPGRIRWVHRNLFDIGDETALAAAQLGEAAYQKGRFWEFHDAVFNPEARLDRDRLQKIVRALDLDWDGFQSGRFENDILLKVKKDITDARQYGTTSVPVLFVNGLYFSPTFSYDRLQAMVAGELNRKATAAQTKPQTALPSSSP